MEPRDTVQRYADAWRANDIARVFELYHDDFVLHYFGESPLAGDHRGKEAAIGVLVEATQRSGRQLDEIEDVLAGATYGAIVARELVGHGDEATVVRRLFVYTVRDGKLAECWLYDQDQRAIDRLWSTPPDPQG
jgi:ketosteroid isomerase-like protein